MFLVVLFALCKELAARLPWARGPWHPLLAREPFRWGCPFSSPPLPAAFDSPDSRGPCFSLRILVPEAETLVLERTAANHRRRWAAPQPQRGVLSGYLGRKLGMHPRDSREIDKPKMAERVCRGRVACFYYANPGKSSPAAAPTACRPTSFKSGAGPASAPAARTRWRRRCRSAQGRRRVPALGCSARRGDS